MHTLWQQAMPTRMEMNSLQRGIPLGQTMRTSVERHCTVSAANNVYISGDGSE